MTDGVWQGKTEKWYKFENGKLFVSENIAMDWVKSLDNKWEGADGNWYRLDEKAKLWVGKPNPVSWN